MPDINYTPSIADAPALAIRKSKRQRNSDRRYFEFSRMQEKEHKVS
jgi:hypothetical protein